jgi:hypothetical protein
MLGILLPALGHRLLLHCARLRAGEGDSLRLHPVRWMLFTRPSKDPWARWEMPAEVASRLPSKLTRSGFDGVAYWGLVQGTAKKPSETPPVRLHWVIGQAVGHSIDEFQYQYNPTFDRGRNCAWLVTFPKRIVRVSLEDGRQTVFTVDGIDIADEREPLFAEPWLLADGRLLLAVALSGPYGGRKVRPVGRSDRGRTATAEPARGSGSTRTSERSDQDARAIEPIHLSGCTRRHGRSNQDAGPRGRHRPLDNHRDSPPPRPRQVRGDLAWPPRASPLPLRRRSSFVPRIRP